MRWILGTAFGIMLLLGVVVWTGPRWLVRLIAARAPGCLYSVATQERVVALTIGGGCVGYILANVRPGAVIVLHDGRRRGPRTAETMRHVPPTLRARGYRVVSLSELDRAAAGRAGMSTRSSPAP